MSSDDIAPPLGSPTARWRPMAFGDRAPEDIPDPVYEPLWLGHRALVEISAHHVVIREVDLGDRTGAAALRAALAAANLADEVVLDGYLVPAPVPGTDDGPLSQPSATGITGRQMLRQMFLGGVGRSARRRAVRRVEERLVPLPNDGPIAFVAVDLLWLDGEPLLDLPLGERKRLLESVLAEGKLVRRTMSVHAPAERWYGQWRALGFREIAVKAANSRYRPGGLGEDWTIIPIPGR